MAKRTELQRANMRIGCLSRKYPDKSCAICGVIFKATGGGSKFCPTCKLVHVKAQLVENQRKFRLENPTYYRDKNRALREADPTKVSAYQRNRQLKVSYGITQDDYEKILKKQRGKCAICRLTGSGQAGKNYLCVDHDHKTGKIRGLLCHKCNRGIGLLGDSIKNAVAALSYLKGELPCQRKK